MTPASTTAPGAPWWQSAVFYQIYPRSFADSNGDGIGDLPGITCHLDYLTGTLGVDAIWINPLYRSGGVDGGYDITDHCDVDPGLGTLEDLDTLVTAAHARGLHVIIAKDPQLRDNPPNTSRRLEFGRPHGEIDSQLHIHDRGHPDTHGIYREFRQLLDAYLAGQPRVAMAEIALSDIEEWASYYGTALDELHLPFNFQLVNVPWHPSAVRAAVEDTERALPAGAWPSWVLGNHDEPRLTTRLGADRARCATMLLLTLRGTPTLYYGDELGMLDVTVPPERIRDPWEQRVPGQGYGRDPQRSPMRWTRGPNAGFCPPSARPWLPIGRGSNVVTQLQDPNSILSLTTSLLRVRRSRHELALGSYRTLISEGCYAYLRELGDARSLIALNLSDLPIAVDLGDLGTAQVLAGTHGETATINTRHLALRANEGIVAALEASSWRAARRPARRNAGYRGRVP